MKNCLVQGWNNDFVGVEEGRALCNARISITRADLHVSSRYKVNRRNRAASRLAFDLFRNADKLADLLPRSIASTRRICAKSVRWKFDDGKDAFESANGNSVETRSLSIRPIFFEERVPPFLYRQDASRVTSHLRLYNTVPVTRARQR